MSRRGCGFLTILAVTLAIRSGLISAEPGAAFAVSPSITVSSGGAVRQTAATSDLPACLLGHWTSSYEEYTLELRIYRPADFPFPPSRGRTGFAFLAGGELVSYAIAPVDGVLETRGHWSFTPPNLVGIAVDDGMPTTVTLAVVSCSEDLLAIAAP